MSYNLNDDRFWKLEKDGITKTLKSDFELLEENLITKEEYNILTNQKRQASYESKTDNQVIELMRNFLNNNKAELYEEDKKILDNINTEIDSIKKEYPKEKIN